MALGDDVNLPDNPAEGVTDALFDAGPAMPGMHGPVPLSATELLAWSTGTGVGLSGWEFSQVLYLSRIYVNQLPIFSSRAAPAPWMPELTEDHRATVSKRVRNLLRDE